MNFDDPEYDRFLAECARECRCCSRCWDVPCAGCTAGGICDAMCTCTDGWEDDPDFYGDDKDGTP